MIVDCKYVNDDLPSLGKTKRYWCIYLRHEACDMVIIVHIGKAQIWLQNTTAKSYVASNCNSHQLILPALG